MTIQIKTLEREQINRQQWYEIVDLCSEAFEVDYAPFLDAFGPTTHVIGIIDSTIVTHALWLPRTLRVGKDVDARSAYVEAVATRPAYKRRGFATAVMQVLQSRLRAYDFGALATSVPAFYEALGWRQWIGTLLVDRAGVYTETTNECVMIYAIEGQSIPDVTQTLTAPWRPNEPW
jgi:aminoglycoside 2'-N-acetyltransferase I